MGICRISQSALFPFTYIYFLAVAFNLSAHASVSAVPSKTDRLVAVLERDIPSTHFCFST